MAKSKEQLLAKSKARRQKNLQASKDLKFRKNWYKVTDTKNHFKRPCKKPHATHIHKKLTPFTNNLLSYFYFTHYQIFIIKILLTFFMF